MHWQVKTTICLIFNLALSVFVISVSLTSTLYLCYNGEYIQILDVKIVFTCYLLTTHWTIRVNMVCIPQQRWVPPIHHCTMVRCKWFWKKWYDRQYIGWQWNGMHVIVLHVFSYTYLNSKTKSCIDGASLIFSQ